MRPATASLALAFALVGTVAPDAQAQSRLERMEHVSVALGRLANEAILLESPELAGRLPNPDWDAPLRAAYACVIDAYVEAAGGAAVDALLDQMEAALPGLTADTLFAEEIDRLIDVPDGLGTTRAQETVGACGVVELTMQRMIDAGMMGE